MFLTKYSVFPEGRPVLFLTEFLYRWWMSSDIMQQNWSKFSLVPFTPLQLLLLSSDPEGSEEAELLLDDARSLIPLRAFSTSFFVSSRFVNILYAFFTYERKLPPTLKHPDLFITRTHKYFSNSLRQTGLFHQILRHPNSQKFSGDGYKSNSSSLSSKFLKNQFRLQTSIRCI